MKNKICHYDEGNPQVIIFIDGYEYSHSVKGLPKDKHEWYLDVFSRQMQEVHDRAYKKGKDEVRHGIKSILDIK